MKTFVFRAGGSLKAALCCAVALALVGFTAAFACDSLFLPPKQAFCASNGRSLPIYSVQTSEKKAAIGINCAWDDRDILPMLSTLQQNGVHATFFLLGEWAQKYPDAARTIARAGQEIGSHSNSHRDMDTLSQEEILQEIHLSCQNIHAACGTDACPLSSTFRCLQRFGHRLHPSQRLHPHPVGFGYAGLAGSVRAGDRAAGAPTACSRLHSAAARRR